jgi:pimeloyl-ACP methyl ester carboxylesterase
VSATSRRATVCGSAAIAAAAVGAAVAAAVRARTKHQPVKQGATGTSANGMEYARLGDGDKTLLFIGGGPGSEIPAGLMARVMSNQHKPFVRAGYNVWIVTRQRGMPPGHSIADMAGDYAKFITDELGGHVDLVVGESYGGIIAQYLAANHPALVDRVVLALAAGTITEWGRDVDVRWATARAEGRNDDAGAVFLEYVIPGAHRAAMRRRLGPLAGRMFAHSVVPAGDLLVEAQAEAAFDARGVLTRIQSPVLILCGDEDQFFSRDIVEETASLIPDCTVVWYEGMGHMRAAMSGRIPTDVLTWVSTKGREPA